MPYRRKIARRGISEVCRCSVTSATLISVIGFVVAKGSTARARSCLAAEADELFSSHRRQESPVKCPTLELVTTAREQKGKTPELSFSARLGNAAFDELRTEDEVGRVGSIVSDVAHSRGTPAVLSVQLYRDATWLGILHRRNSLASLRLPREWKWPLSIQAPVNVFRFFRKESDLTHSGAYDVRLISLPWELQYRLCGGEQKSQEAFERV